MILQQLLFLPILFLVNFGILFGPLVWTILLRDRPDGGIASDDLVCHELCHVWQM